LGPGPRLIKKKYRAAVSQMLRNTALEDAVEWTGCVWLKLRTTDGLLWQGPWTFLFHIRRGISSQTQKLLTFQGRLH